ncbi:MAG: RsmB/NOP family class I SAM-dependent RNA methyltransferase [Clostridia bacterium]|nr:RsmB/NOP family class I SAM-dependent RNA methyltransferase [Clostridia bacterium]
MSETGMPRLPDAFLARMQERLGEAFPAFLASYELPSVRGIRLNPWKVPETQQPEGMGERIPWAEYGYELSSSSGAGLSVLHEAGAWYLQEPSAMLPAAVLDAKCGETVLDACAAPGGKTTQMAFAMEGQGLLIANEYVRKRAQVLAGNVERMGITNAIVTSADTALLAAKWPHVFDAVMVDAPCSGEGMFRRLPESREEWSEDAVRACAQRQREILSHAAQTVRGGGRLVYATCTLNVQENEENVIWFLTEHPEFMLEPFSLPGVDGSLGYVTCFPHLVRGEGQFVAKFRRTDEEAGEMAPIRERAVPKETKQCLQAFSQGMPECVHALGDTLFSLRQCPDLTGIQVLRAGLHLGQVRKGNFFPDHALAMSATPPKLPRLALTHAQATAYLMGETMEAEGMTGYVLACYDGLPLGIGKCAQGRMNNHYPKGLRRQVR